MEFDPYGTLIIKSSNHILTLFHLYCGSKHKLCTILYICSHISILIQNIVPGLKKWVNMIHVSKRCILLKEKLMVKHSYYNNIDEMF